MSLNTNLHNAKNVKNDEFYTKFSDIENELEHYKSYFKGKIIYCNCDDPRTSEFWRYFHLNFHKFSICKLLSTYYDRYHFTYKFEYTGGCDEDINDCVKTSLKTTGDFRNQDCIRILKESDIVVTNPPFSLFRDFISMLMTYNKKFIIIGSKNSITYKEIFTLFKDNKIWLGYNSVHEFKQPDNTFKKFGNIGWYTNLKINRKNDKLVLFERYYDDNGTPLPESRIKYPKYDNYDAINVDRLSDIPCDYFGVIGVPITFMEHYNPSDFNIIGTDYEYAKPVVLDNGKTGNGRFYLTRERESPIV